MINKKTDNLNVFSNRRYGAPSAPSLLRTLLLISLLLAATSLYDSVQAVSNLHVSDLAPLQIAPGTRLLVISPHPDDELLSGGGIIQRVMEAGGQVEVVMVTNGDGQIFAPSFLGGRLKLRPADYIAMGLARQKETLKALQELGLKSDQVIFLGYPDRRIRQMWNSDWQNAKPVRAPYTRTTESPYPNSFELQAKYRGSDLYNDLVDILERYRPDVILVPHPEDTNSDHSAVSDFARFAIATSMQAKDHKDPLVLAYLVHYEAYPLPRGDDTALSLLPPAPLADGGSGWLSLALTGPERSGKRNALRAYFSQLRMMPTYMKSFARANEIYFDLPVTQLPVIGMEDKPELENDLLKEVGNFEPRRERFDRLLWKSGDLVGSKVTRVGDLVCYAAQTRGPIARNVSYRIQAKLPDGRNLQVTRQSDLLLIGDHLFGACFHLSELGNPPSIGFSAQTSANFLLDQTAWSFASFSSLPTE